MRRHNQHKIFKTYRDRAAKHPIYVTMRKHGDPMNNDYDRDDGSHISLDEQLEIDTELTELHQRYDRLIEKVYLMGYNKGLLHNTDNKQFP